MLCIEKIICYLLWLVSPLASIPFGGLERARRWLENEMDFKNKMTTRGWKFETISVPGESNVQVVMARPQKLTEHPVPLVVYLHGGGYTLGTPKDSVGSTLWVELAARGADVVVASVGYRTAPEHAAPAAQEDIEAAIAHLVSSTDLLDRFGYDPTRLHLWGNSAGGGLALVVGAAMARRGGLPRRPASLLLDCPVVDPACDSASWVRNAAASQVSPAVFLKWSWQQYLGPERDVATARCDAAISPSIAPGGLEGLSGVPALVCTSKADVLHDEGVDLSEALAEAGVETTHIDMRSGHCTGWVFDKPNAEIALTIAASFLRREAS